jgi:hypothetical protein
MWEFLIRLFEMVSFGQVAEEVYGEKLNYKIFGMTPN